MDIERIEKLNELRERGLITDEEFATERAKAVAAEVDTRAPGTPGSLAEQPNREASRNYAVFLHLSLLLGWVIPLFGFLVPVIMWQLRKDDPFIDQHGRIAVNWMFSLLIYFFVLILFSVLSIITFLLGFAVLAIGLFCLISVIFIIMGAVHASAGRIKSYPLTIPFFAVDEVQAS